MILRSFRPSDLDTLCAIDQACFSPDIAYSREEMRNFITHRASRSWVAEEEGVIVGFLIANRQPRKVGHIITIDVVEPMRRQGVGSKLMDAVEQWSREQGLRFIYLETAEDNLTAQRFYTRRGYRRYRKIEGYYRNGSAAWVMVKGLEEQLTVDS